jgi:hypothetical protein
MFGVASHLRDERRTTDQNGDDVAIASRSGFISRYMSCRT